MGDGVKLLCPIYIPPLFFAVFFFFCFAASASHNLDVDNYGASVHFGRLSLIIFAFQSRPYFHYPLSSHGGKGSNARELSPEFSPIVGRRALALDVTERVDKFAMHGLHGALARANSKRLAVAHRLSMCVCVLSCLEEGRKRIPSPIISNAGVSRPSYPLRCCRSSLKSPAVMWNASLEGDTTRSKRG